MKGRVAIAISGFAVVAVWLSICAAHFVFRRRHLQSGKPSAALQYRAPWYPLVPVPGFVLCLMACIGLAFDPDQRIALYCALLRSAVCRPLLWFTHKTKLKEADYAAD